MEASLGAAQAEFAAISQGLTEQFPDTHQGVEIFIQSYNEEFNGGEIKVLFLALMAAVGFVLLIACANVANLLLARSSSRAREMSVRSAMGAGRLQLVRQLLIESLLMSGLGGIVGLGLSAWGVRMFDLATASVDKPYWVDFSIDLKVIFFLAAVCVATGVLFGLAPALHAARTDLNTVLRDGGGGQAGGSRVKRATATLVVVQIALTVVLLFGAGLMLKSFQKLRNLDLGIRQDNLLTLRLGLPEAKYPSDEEQIAFQEALSDKLASLPGVESAAVTSHLPIGGSFQWSFELAGEPITDGRARPRAQGLIASPGYFTALGTVPTQGRGFHERDGREGAGAVIVNEAFAAVHWGVGNALGQRLRLGKSGEEGPWLTVVGVAPAIRQGRPTQVEVDPTLYLPYRQAPERFFTILARSRSFSEKQGISESLTLDIQKAVQSIDPDLPLYFIGTDEGIRQKELLGLPDLRQLIRHLRPDRPGAVVGGGLRGDDLRRQPASAGDRRAHGDGRRRWQDCLVDPARRPASAVGRFCRRCAGGPRPWPGAARIHGSGQSLGPRRAAEHRRISGAERRYRLPGAGAASGAG